VVQWLVFFLGKSRSQKQWFLRANVDTGFLQMFPATNSGIDGLIYYKESFNIGFWWLNCGEV